MSSTLKKGKVTEIKRELRDEVKANKKLSDETLEEMEKVSNYLE